MTMTVAIAQAHLDAWLAADLGRARNANYTMPDGRQLTRPTNAEIKEAISRWQRTIDALNAAAAGVANPGVKIATWSNVT